MEESPQVKGGKAITGATAQWQALKEADLSVICDCSLAKQHSSSELILRFLETDILVDIENCQLKHRHHGQWNLLDHPLQELITLVYLQTAAPALPRNDMIGVNELKDAIFFQGAHDLPVAPLLARFGYDPGGFRAAAENKAGEPLEHADAAYRFYPFPKIPLYYLLWEGDDEFQPSLSILFDRSIENHLAADAILGTVNLVSEALLID
ncbi:MAG: DUF3786 domain-containing protein [Desulfobacterales bacterium]